MDLSKPPHFAYMLLEAIPAFNDNYIWLIHYAHGKVAVVDPGDAEPVLKALADQNISLGAVLITHHHADHTGGVAKLIKLHPAPVFGPIDKRIPLVSHPVQDGQEISLEHGGARWRVIACPGHTTSHIAYYSDNKLFCGDTMFSVGCGRLFEGSAAQMYQSLQKFAELPINTQIYCAHEYTDANCQFALVVEPENSELICRAKEVRSRRAANLPTIPVSLEMELKTNPFLRTHLKSVQNTVSNYAGIQMDEPLETFAYLRRWKDQFTS